MICKEVNDNREALSSSLLQTYSALNLFFSNIRDKITQTLFFLRMKHLFGKVSYLSFPNATTVHGMKACYFDLGTKIKKGKDNKKELLEKH